MKNFFKRLFAPKAKIPDRVFVSPGENKYLAQFPKDMRPFELCFMRVSASKGWKGFEKAKYKIAFMQGWNSAVFMEAKYSVLTTEDVEEIQKRKNG